uniref:Uncharacterized protein n=1 Tax=Anopheles arabiensis TaxID=7173 RepID=A0A182IEY2_ANOAR
MHKRRIFQMMFVF